MSTLPLSHPALPSGDDADLVAAALAGSRDAFAAIITRYRALVCSVAYSATGSLSQSEDVAQEAFVAAWRGLADLREPDKLRGWLCGIAKNLASNAKRRAARDPAHAADPIDVAEATPAREPMALEQTIGKEEEAILWRAIEGIAETYRTPLILFYREQESIERVGALLDLGEDVVRQRLTRGRRLLAERVTAFVEGTLARSAPGDDFTIAVLGALPATSAGVSAATTSVAVAKATGVTKSVAAAGAALAFAVSMGTGIYSLWSGLRTGLSIARTPREKALVWRQWLSFLGAALAFTAAVLGLILPSGFWAAHEDALLAAAVALPAVFAPGFVALTLRSVRAQRRLRDALGRPTVEWKSRATLLGLPLWHVRIDVPGSGAPPVIAWVAVGDPAIGILFALGSTSCGAVSVGAVSVGLLSIGTVSVGAVTVGSVAVGLVTLGTVAAGLVAFGGIAFATHGASGAVAFSRGVAGGDLAFAPHANDAATSAFFTSFHAGAVVDTLLVLTVLLIVFPLTYVRRRAKRLAATPE